MNELTFKNQTIVPVIVNNLPYLTASQVGIALNYARPDKINSIPFALISFCAKQATS